MNEITININEANKAQKYQDEKELFQIDAFRKVADILKEHTVGKDRVDITDCRFHDTIFIDGDRGVGKTAFMINIQHYYETFYKVNENETKPNYIFLKPIDPTLLEHTEKFLSVVLAKIVEYVSDNKKTDQYFSVLDKLSKSLEAIKTLPEDIGISEIASNKSSLKLEQHAHEFFQIVKDMFGVNAIVMLIDDVDMAFDKGFDVLEVVRKYLASPYLIPIVAGDMKLYKEIIETRFKEKIQFFNDIQYLKDIYASKLQESREYKEKIDLLNNLVEQYLEKIFPNEYHVKLKNIFTILKENKVDVIFNAALSVPYTEVKDFEIRHINLGINQVKFSYQVFSDNTRDLIQYLYSKRDIYIYFFSNLKNYSKSLEHNKYIPQNVIKKFDDDIMKMVYDKSFLYKRSLEITSQIYEYRNAKQKELSILTTNDVQAYKNGSYSVYEAFTGKAFDNNLKLNNEKAIPKLAIYYEDYRTTIPNASDRVKYIVDLFVHNNYYRDNMTKNYIFAGKFLEFMFYSLGLKKELQISKDKQDEIDKIQTSDFAINETLEKKFTEIKKFLETNSNDFPKNIDSIKEIAYKIPFNSEFSKNNNYEKSTQQDESVDDESSTILYQEEYLNELNYDLLVWRLFIDSIKLNSISIYEIVHKFFNNLNILKEKSNDFIDETPLTFMQRIVFVFINSVAFFETTEKRVAETNIAVSDKFSLQVIIEHTNAYNQNIKPLLNKKSLTNALFFHPIISYILFPNENSELNNLRFVKSKQNKNQLSKDTKNIEIKEVEKLYLEIQNKTEKDYSNKKYIEMFRITYTLISSDDFTKDQKEYTYKRIYNKNARWYKAFNNLPDDEKVKVNDTFYKFTNMKFNA